LPGQPDHPEHTPRPGSLRPYRRPNPPLEVEGTERPSRRRGRLQGPGPRLAGGGRDRSPTGRSGAVIQGNAVNERPRVAVVDHGAGNLVSISQALERVGAEAVLAADPGALADVEGVVLPG